MAILVDGRRLTVPLTWSWRLLEATPRQRRRFEIIGDGTGVRWPEIDEDISIDGMRSRNAGTRGRRRDARVDPAWKRKIPCGKWSTSKSTQDRRQVR
ncbi:MAG: DUF2442 domain-containing protein [Pseudomonadota bacterium]|nr:DUF2442 domain-containing protein [Pseudomonadota bacterium]